MKNLVLTRSHYWPNPEKIIKGWVFLLVFLLLPQLSAKAATYTVGNGETYSTISACEAVARAGDTCLVYPGVYNERVTENYSGTAGNPITYEAESPCNVAIPSTCAIVEGFTLTNQSYITIEGFEITDVGMTLQQYATGSIFMQSSSYINILNNNINNTQGGCIQSHDQNPIQITNNTLIQGNTLSHCGNQITGGTGWVAAPAIVVFGNNNLIQNNDISHNGEDYMDLFGNYNVYRNNNLHNNSLSDGPPGDATHIDGVQTWVDAAATVASGGTGYSVGDVLNIIQTPASNSPNPIGSALIAAGGTGYVVGDVLNVVQSGASGGTVTVAKVSSGVIQGITLTTKGSGYTTASGLSTTGGSGTGATVNISNGITVTVSAVNCSPLPCTGPITHVTDITGGQGYSNANGLASTNLSGSMAGSGATFNLVVGIPTQYFLVENNSYSDSPSANEHFTIFQDEGQPTFGSKNVIVRYNNVSNGGEFIINDEQVANVIIYNNSLDNLGVGTGKNWTDINYSAFYQNSTDGYSIGATGGQVKNNIYYNTVYNTSSSGGEEDTVDPYSEAGYFADYNLAYNSGCGTSCAWNNPGDCPGINCPLSGQETHSLLNHNPLYNNVPLFGMTTASAGTTTQIETANPNNYTFNVGDNIEYNTDGVDRTVTTVGNGYIIISPALSSASAAGDTLLDWGSSTNFTYDLSLKTGSPAIGAGGALTTVVSVSGTTLVVNNASYFQPGWAGVNPDWISVGTTSNAVEISSINYSTNTITLVNALPVNANPGDPVWLYKDSNGRRVLFGNAPDMGANPHYVIPDTSRIDWSPGIPGGIPDGYPNYNTTNSSGAYYWPICATINAGEYGNGTIDASTAINTALSSCPDHEVVALSTGTFMIANGINLMNRSGSDYNGVVLRGAGPANTKIIYSGSGTSSGGIFRLGSTSSNGFPQQTIGNINAGSNQLTIASLSNIAAGDWVSIANGISNGVPFITSIGSISSVTFTVSGITDAPTIGSTYSNNYSPLTVLSTSLSGSPGSIAGTITCTYGTRPPYPSSSGTLTKSSGTGDATINFSSYNALLTLASNIGTTITNGTVNFSPYTSFVTFNGSQTVIPKGSTTISVGGNTSQITAGSYIVISQNNVPGLVSVFPYGSTDQTTGSINSGSDQLILSSNTSSPNLSAYTVGSWVTIAGAGPGGLALNTTISNVSGYTLTLGANATNTVSNAVVYLPGYCGYCGDDTPNNVMGQIDQVTAVNGNILTLNRPLYYDLDQSLMPTVTVELLTQNSGVEDVYLHPSQATYSANFIMELCAHCWVADVESDTAGAGNGAAHVEFENSYGNVLRDSYIHDAYAHESGSGYGAWIMGWNSDHLIENNIFRRTRHSMIFEGGGSGVVFAYNYSINNIEALGADNYTTWDDNAMSPDSVTHGAFPYMNLYEGNVSAQLAFDNAHGNSAYNTAFRNYFTGMTTYPTGTPGTASAWVTWGLIPVNDSWSSDYENVADNILGIPNCGSNPLNNTYASYDPTSVNSGDGNFTIYALGYYDGGYSAAPITDPNLVSGSTLSGAILRFDNYNCVNADVPSSENSGQPIPASLYLSGKPSWFGTLPWPAIGSELTPTVGMIPALQRYLAIQAAGTVHMFPGDKTGDENPAGIPLTSSTTSVFNLAVTTAGSGYGEVFGVDNASPTLINCGENPSPPPNVCSASVNSGTIVTLTATPASGSLFLGWSGACSGTGSCTVTMNAAQNVIATFGSAQVNGSCGPASQTYLYSATGFESNALCRSGTPNPTTVNFPLPGTEVKWACVGSGNGFNSTCAAKRNSRTIIKLL